MADAAHHEAVGGSEDAFDAAVSALEMWRHTEELSSLPPAPDGVGRVEGLAGLPGACRSTRQRGIVGAPLGSAKRSGEVEPGGERRM